MSSGRGARQRPSSQRLPIACSSSNSVNCRSFSVRKCARFPTSGRVSHSLSARCRSGTRRKVSTRVRREAALREPIRMIPRTHIKDGRGIDSRWGTPDWQTANGSLTKSEDVLQCKLHDPRIGCCHGLSERLPVQSSARILRVHMVWRVKRFSTEFERLTFTNLEPASQTEIQIDEPRASQLRRVSVTARQRHSTADACRLSGNGERVDVQPVLRQYSLVGKTDWKQSVIREVPTFAKRSGSVSAAVSSNRCVIWDCVGSWKLIRRRWTFPTPNMDNKIGNYRDVQKNHQHFRGASVLCQFVDF
jgi:hypothetical protein